MNSQAKKNAVLLVLAAAITGTVLTGCGGQQPGAKPTSTKPGFSRSTEIGKEKQSDLTITTTEAATKAEKSKGNAFDDGKVKPKSDKHKGDKAKPDQSKRDKKNPDKPKKEKTTEAATTDEAKETAKEAATDKKGDNANATEQKATENSIETAETTKETKKSKSN